MKRPGLAWSEWTCTECGAVIPVSIPTSSTSDGMGGVVLMNDLNEATYTDVWAHLYAEHPEHPAVRSHD